MEHGMEIETFVNVVISPRCSLLYDRMTDVMSVRLHNVYSRGARLLPRVKSSSVAN